MKIMKNREVQSLFSHNSAKHDDSHHGRHSAAIVMAGILTLSLSGCAAASTAENTQTSAEAVTVTESVAESDDNISGTDDTAGADLTSQKDAAGSGAEKKDAQMSGLYDRESAVMNTAASTEITEAEIDTDGIFSDRDLEQEADTDGAETITLSDDQNITITEAGVYVISGSAKNCSIIVEAGEDDKVQLVLDGVTITNESAPAIYVKSADKVFVTTTDSENSMSVTGAFEADSENNLDAVIFSKTDLTLNGVGTLTINSTANGISGKDDMVVTGGTYDITCTEDAFEANDSIAVSGGTFTISTQKDAFNSGDNDDDTTGWIYISGGTFDIEAGDDGVHATTILQIDGGTFDISAVEGLEATYVLINDGTITIDASDDGINASSKSSAYSVVVEINGGDLTITMGDGDTDAVDANGAIIVNGGTIDITAQSAFDYDTTGTLNGGTVTVNGEEVDELTGGMPGGMGGGRGGGMGGHGGPGRVGTPGTGTVQ